MYSITELQPLFSTPIERRGANYFVRCPFHKDNTPSLCLFLKKGTFRCYGGSCGEYGKIKDLPRKLGRNFSIREDFFEEQTNEKIEITPIDLEYVESYHQNLYTYPQLKERVLTRVPCEETIKKYKLGYSTDRTRYTIPIIEKGICWNIKMISFSHKIKQMNWKKHYGIPRLFLYEEVVDSQKIIIAAGEWDCLLLKSMGFPAVTSTAGEGSWNDDWNDLFADKDVYIVYDQDAAGIIGAKKLAEHLFSVVRSIKIIHFDIEMGEGGDTTDYFLKFHKTKKEFIECLKNGVLYFPEKKMKFFGV